jgi:hypothetical protein
LAFRVVKNDALCAYGKEAGHSDRVPGVCPDISGHRAQIECSRLRLDLLGRTHWQERAKESEQRGY